MHGQGEQAQVGGPRDRAGPAVGGTVPGKFRRFCPCPSGQVGASVAGMVNPLARTPSPGWTFPVRVARPPGGAYLDPARRGLLLGLLAVTCFSLTPVASRAAVAGGLSPLFVAAGRAFGAALLAAPLLWLARQPCPARAHLPRLLAVVLGTVLGFPLLMTWALGRVSAAHAGAVLGLLPLATSVVGAVRGRERLPWLFWASAVAGSAVVVAFTWSQGGGGGLAAADLALLGAVLAAAVGYAEGALLSRVLGGWQTISWALVLGAPVTGAVLLVQLVGANGGGNGGRLATGIAPGAWAGFGYVTLVSQFLGFFPWYRGLALGGVARVGQLQLLQPFLTLVAAALLLGESISRATVATASLVLATVALGRGTTRLQPPRQSPGCPVRPSRTHPQSPSAPATRERRPT